MQNNNNNNSLSNLSNLVLANNRGGPIQNSNLRNDNNYNINKNSTTYCDDDNEQKNISNLSNKKNLNNSASLNKYHHTINTSNSN